MSDDDRSHWDDRHARFVGTGGPPSALESVAHLFPTAGTALELACGGGAAAVWLAERGMGVWGVDVSPLAIEQAHILADAEDVADRCRFDVVDLDDGLPDGPQVDLILCHMFRDARLDAAIVDRLASGGMLAIAVLSEVDARPGRYRAAPGELATAFAELEILASGEADGVAWLVGRRR